MRQFTRFFFFSITILLLITSPLFASGNKVEVQTEPPKKTGAGTPIEIYNPGYKYPTEAITLNFWHIMGARAGWDTWIRSVAEKYSQLHPNVTIKIRDVPTDIMNNVWETAYAGNVAPDICCFSNIYTMQYRYVKDPVPNWVAKVLDTEFTDVGKSTAKWMDGKYYGFFISELDPGLMLYYNNDMFKEAGLVRPPATLPELLEYAKKLTVRDQNGEIKRAGIGLRLDPGFVFTDKFHPVLGAFVDSSKKDWLFTADYADTIIDSPPFVKALQFYRDLIWEYKVASSTFPRPDDQLKLKLCAMAFRESFLYGSIKKDVPDMDIRIAPKPVGAAPFGQFAPGPWPNIQWAYASPQSKHPDIAWDVICYVFSDENELALTQYGGGFTRKNANMNNPIFKALPWYDTYFEMFKRPWVYDYKDRVEVFTSAYDSIGRAGSEVTHDKNADVQAALAKYAAATRELLKRK